VGTKTYELPKLFLVMATQNPLEQEGTYPLPEAQLDRFLMHVTIDYPDAAAEQKILELNRSEARNEGQVITDDAPHIVQADLFSARTEVLDVHLAEPLEQYLLQLVLASRNPGAYGQDIQHWLEYGASPRASIALDRCARAHAWLDGRDYVTPDDIQLMAFDVMRHRIILSFEAEAEGITSDRFINELINRVAVP
jgi:MoxR-like ATPase